MSQAVTVLVGGADPGAPLAAYRVSGDGEASVIGDGVRATPEGPCALVIPASDVQVRRLAIPARTQAQARAAAPFLFEGGLAEDAGAVHYAVGEALNADGERLVTAMAHARLDAWLQACRAVGADPDAIFVDVTLWPAPERTVDIVERDGLTLVAAGAAGGYAIESALAPALFRRWLTQAAGLVDRARHATRNAAPWAEALAGLPQAPAPDLPVGLTLARAAADAPPHAPDLLQGVHERTADSGGWRFWRVGAALLVLTFLVHTGVTLLAGWRDAQAAQATIAMAERDLRAARPELGRIASLRAQVSALKNAASRAGSHPVLAVNTALVESMKAQPLVRLDEVRHADPGRRVSLRISAADAAALEAVAVDLRNRRLAVEMRASQPVAGRPTAELVVDAP